MSASQYPIYIPLILYTEKKSLPFLECITNNQVAECITTTTTTAEATTTTAAPQLSSSDIITIICSVCFAVVVVVFNIVLAIICWPRCTSHSHGRADLSMDVEGQGGEKVRVACSCMTEWLAYLISKPPNPPQDPAAHQI